MVFTEKTKLKVKNKAMFQCCRCRSTGVDVHHIERQRENGDDTFENAAPLCPNCHRWFGDNPTKKTEIRQMRDNWYETVERMYGPNSSEIIPKIEQIDKKLNEHSTNLDEMKNILKEISNEAIDNMTLGTANVVASNITNASGASLSNVRSENILEFDSCPKCFAQYLPPSSVCPFCQHTKNE